MLMLEAFAPGEWSDALQRVRGAVGRCGTILEERPFSGVMVSYELELSRTRALQLIQAMAEREIRLTRGSALALEAAVAAAAESDQDLVPARLSVHFPNGDPDKRQVVPKVPG